MKSQQLNTGSHRMSLACSKKECNLNVFSFLLFILCIVLFLQVIKVFSELKTSQSYLRLTQPRTMFSSSKCTFVVVCGFGDVDTVKEMKPLITSAILLSTCPLHFIFVTDNRSVENVSNLFKNDLTNSYKPLSVDVWTISTDFIRSWARSFKFDTQGAGWKKKIWLTSKLFIPWLLKDLDRVIVIDSDMIFLEDPAQLWEQFDDSSWAYKMPINNATRDTDICSCVVLINIQTALKHDIYRQKFFRALVNDEREINNETGLYRTVRVDQAVYYSLFKSYPWLFRSLQDHFNADNCHNYNNAFSRNSKVKVSLLHINCQWLNRTSQPEADIFFSFYKSFKWSWLKPSKLGESAIQINVYKQNVSQFSIIEANP